MKKLRDILYKSGMTDVSGSTDILVGVPVFNSKEIKKGDLFIAVTGTVNDGHRFIAGATDSGAAAVVCESFPETFMPGITYVKVKNSQEAMAHIAANYYDHPSSKLKLIGVTGTNGKTTTVTLLHNLFTALGFQCGLLSTVKNQVSEKVIPATHTTPDAIRINQLLAEMTDAGCTYCFMEVSSHAVVQHRVTGLEFAGGLFTNITHDHLDYHKTFDAYIKAKKGFFDMLPMESFALVNADDKNHKVMIQNTKAKKKTYSLKSASDFRCRVIENNFSGLLLNIDGTEVLTRLIGSFNAYNLLGIYATALLLGIEKISVLTAISTLAPVEGRFEYITAPNHITGIVDYAHTPDALQNVLTTIKDIRTGNENVITIIGCGGDRDAAKRPLMAGIACELSNRVILTSDNPRSEDPEEILQQMKKGVPPQHYKKALVISDRKEAIKTACSLAAPGDIILLAGKGHEKYQEIKGVKYPFDDKLVLQEAFDLMIN
jgi:UDP-N-acetylmuramoyl-L-alanyl-D-glutamate--2,6-diaminopimelate ligase